MSRTPGVIIPSFYSSREKLEADLRRRDKEAGHVPFNIDDYFLEHFGTPGMKWGVRKSKSQQTESPSVRVSKINEKLEKFNAERIVGGAGMVGYYQKKHISKYPYGQAQARLAVRGAIEAAVLLGGGTFLVKKLGASPRTLRGSQIALGLLAVTQIGVTRVNEIHNVGVYKKHTKLINEKRALEKEMKKKK